MNGEEKAGGKIKRKTEKSHAESFRELEMIVQREKEKTNNENGKLTTRQQQHQ